MIKGQWFAPGSDIAACAAIREAVFGRGTDALDQESWNVMVYNDEEPAATGRLWWKDGAFCLGDIAVLPALRGRRLGDLTLRLLLFKAETHAARMIRLQSPEDVCAFFERLGFHREEADDCLVPMFLPGDELCLDTCASCKKNCPNRQA